MKMYALIPTNGRKSFYGKANVIIDDKKEITYLRSYETIHCGIDSKGVVHRYSDYKSTTTCSHLKSFLGGKYVGYWELPLEKKPTITIEL